MDTHTLNFPCKEEFISFDSANFLDIDDESESIDGTSSHVYSWEWDVERELNGDVALIPMASEVGMNYLSHSPPIKEDIHKIMSEWHHFINTEIPEVEEIEVDLLSIDEEEIALNSNKDCINNRRLNVARSGGKKIDMNAQCYILEEKKNIEVQETSDSVFSSAHIKMEPLDISSVKIEPLMDNFLDVMPTPELPEIELTPLTDLEKNFQAEYIDVSELAPLVNLNNTEAEPQVIKNEDVDVDTVSEQATPILEARDLNSLLEQFEATETVNLQTADLQKIASNVNTENKEESKSEDTEESTVQNKQILEALPEELIMRIKASSKRKTVPVIDPIPAKRRGVKKPHVEEIFQSPPVQKDIPKACNSESIKMDHDYCNLLTPYPKHPQKDSGFESAEEEEQRIILRSQPTFKSANGKLMVSLLKANTIRNNIISENNNKKRKLNLEEYKKRREGLISLSRSCNNSQNNSPDTSGRNSPAVIEDEQERLIRHQQKLMQMAAEVLKTPAKSAIKSTLSLIPLETQQKETPHEPFTAPAPPPPPIPPENIEVKVLVSIGVNTDYNLDITKQFNLPVAELEEIKPILETATSKIGTNSLITSVIENLKNKKKQNVVVAQDTSKDEHAEDKIIAYLDKNRTPTVTNSVEVQTELSGSAVQRKSCRRRNSSSSSVDSRASNKKRSSSKESHYSISSRSSSASSSVSSRSHSSSRSPSPVRKRYNKGTRFNDSEREKIKEVEERRIVYVGGLSSSATKDMLRRRFQKFGPISNISVHFREYGDNYGFVTFVYKADAYEAVEHGNDDPSVPRYDLSFGGRRIFCRTHYSDLDNVRDELGYSSAQVEDSFDNLLREAQAKLRKRKGVNA